MVTCFLSKLLLSLFFLILIDVDRVLYYSTSRSAFEYLFSIKSLFMITIKIIESSVLIDLDKAKHLVAVIVFHIS